MDAASSVSLSSLLVRVALKSHDLRLASLPAIVSTSGRSHGELLRLLYLLEVDVDSEVYCWHRSEFFRRMRALPSAKPP